MFSRLCLSCAAAPCPCGWRSCHQVLRPKPSPLPLHFWPLHLSQSKQDDPCCAGRALQCATSSPGSWVGRDGAGSPRRFSCPLGCVHIKNLLKALHLTFIFLLFILGSGSRLSMKLELDLLATLLKQKPGHCHPYLHGWSVLQQGLRAWSWSGETAAPSSTLLMTWSTSCR